MDEILRTFLATITPALATAQAQIAALPNGGGKHLALLALGQIQVARACLEAALSGEVSVGVSSTPTAAR